jgi:hypothetical protein
LDKGLLALKNFHQVKVWVLRKLSFLVDG